MPAGWLSMRSAATFAGSTTPTVSKAIHRLVGAVKQAERGGREIDAAVGSVPFNYFLVRVEPGRGRSPTLRQETLRQQPNRSGQHGHNRQEERLYRTDADLRVETHHQRAQAPALGSSTSSTSRSGGGSRVHEGAPCGLRQDQDRRVRVRRGGRGDEEPEAQEDRSKKGAPASAAVRYVKGENHSLLLSLHMDIPGLGGRIPWSWKKGSFRRIEFVEMYFFFFFLKIHSFSEYYFAPSNVFEKLDKSLDSADASRAPYVI